MRLAKNQLRTHKKGKDDNVSYCGMKNSFRFSVFDGNVPLSITTAWDKVTCEKCIEYRKREEMAKRKNEEPYNEFKSTWEK